MSVASNFGVEQEDKMAEGADPASAGVKAGGNVLTAILQARAQKKQQERDIAMKLLKESIAQQSKGAGTLAAGTATNLQTILGGIGQSVRR